MSSQNDITGIPAPLPVDYDRQNNFTDYSILYPNTPISGSQLDIEFNAVEQALDQTQARLRLIQRDDGAILNQSIGLDQLKTEALTGVNAPTTWTAFTPYAAKDTVIFDGAAWYLCISSHTASGDFVTDLAGGLWRLLVNLTPFTTEARHWAITAEDTLVAEGNLVDDYSALHHAIKSAASQATSTAQAAISTAQASTSTTQAGISTAQAVIATAQAGTATTQAGTATTQAGTATTQAGIATTQATSATASKNAAAASQTSAATSAGTAATSAGTATTQAGIATTQAGIATTSAGTATTQAGIATTQAGIATTSAGTATTQAGIATTQAGIATTSKNAAQAAQAAAELALDSFDDRYLGAKTSDPTLDNDGNALIDGALIWNSVEKRIKIYDLGTTSWAASPSALVFADQAEAEAGVDNSKLMTALRVLQAIQANVPAAFPAGTLMLFQQTAAPTGWTKQTTHNNKALRVVSGTAGSGGSVAFSTAFTSQSAGGTVGNTTLTTAQMPAHSHTLQTYQYSGGNSKASGGGVSIEYLNANRNNSATWQNVKSSATIDGTRMLNAGSGNSHTHSFTGTAINLAVQYVDLIIASKD